MKKIKQLSFILAVTLVLVGGFGKYQITQAVGGEGTATIDGAANVTVAQSTSHKFTVILTIGVSGITANAQNPTFTIPAGFTAPDASPVANAGLVVTDGNWSVTAAGGTCTVDNPAVGLTAAVGQVITVDVTTTCTVAVPDTITLTYQGQSASAMGATALVIKTADDIGWGEVTAISAPPTITVTSTTATLTVTKTVTNDNDGTKVVADFPLFIDGFSVISGVASTTAIGLHTVSETTDSGYTAVIGGDCASGGTITLTAGENKTCTINNNDVVPASATLHVVNTVINDNGGTAIASDFTIDVTGTNVSPSSFTGSAVGVDVALDAGSYAVTEISLSGYLQSGSGDCSGTIAAGETKTCTITNDDIAPQLIVNKTVVNDNDGTKVIADFPLFIDGFSVISGVASTTAIGLHTVSETTDSGYVATIGGNCATDGKITLALGDIKTCTITNDDIAPVVVPSSSSGGSGGGSYPSPIPPLIDVVKVPNPLALPGGPGPVTYTYTLRNIGTIPVANITMVGDTCSPITLISGDVNTDARLDVNETWIYTCSTTLSKTHTNIVTAIGWGWERGWANGISATDIANSTVIVGVPVVPPLIHVTKVPSPLVLFAEGGIVTYTNKITNPGIVALSNVHLTDDKCDSVKYISGDTNGNSKLDITETWTYTCSTKLTKTTVNTATASGDANGLTARDFAIVTVVVNATVPKLPNTGLTPSEDNTPWNVIVPTGILAILTSLYFARRKQIV